MNKLKTLMFVGALIVIFNMVAGNVIAQQQAVENGITWLINNQNEDGSWGGKPTSLTTSFHTTCVVSNTFWYFGNSTPSYTKAIQWIKGQDVVTVDWISRKIEALAHSGEDVTDLVNLLVSYQNTDGGWRGYIGYESNVIIDTVLALRALHASGYTENTIIERAILYFLDKQNSDGGWPVIKGKDSNIYTTSLVLLVLENYREQYNLHSRLYDGAVWLASQQNGDGGFGKEGSSVWETALAYQALLRQPSANSQQLTATLRYIEDAQLENGSWNNDAYETALALRALKDSAPDLAISAEDVSFSPQVPIEGQPVTITATVHNKGGRPVNDVVVKLGVGSSEFGVKTIPTIGVGGSERVEFSWLAKSGTNEFEITLDPENLISETNENNNSIYFFLTPGTKPDLTLSNQDITFNPSTPQVGDPQLIISANIYNKGETPADNFVVQLTANGQQLTSYNITTIPGGRYVLVQALITGPLPEGTYNIEVIIDSDNRIEETNSKPFSS